MGRLIDADVFVENIVSIADLRTISTKTIGEALDKTPTVDAVPVVHGRWIDLSPQGDNRFMCTVCKWKENVPTCMGEPTIWDFCPSCGARMDGKKSVYGERKDYETD